MQLTPAELAHRLLLTSGGVTALLRRLERAGYLSRHPHPTDGRSIVVVAARETLDRLGEFYAPLAAEQDALTASLSDAERSVLATYLGRVALLSERHVEALVTRVERPEPVDDEAVHLWA